VAAYTAQLGNGLSASLSIEDPRRVEVLNTSMNLNPLALAALSPELNQISPKRPDIVANLRVDQAWGSAQIMGAVHDASGGYYGGTTAGLFGGSCANGIAGTTSNTCSGHPQDKWGFAVGAGIKINFPMIGPGDYFQGQFNYTEGATAYAALTPSRAGNPGVFGNGVGQGSNVGFGLWSDAVFCGANGASAPTVACPNNSVQLTTTWSAQAAYEHFWTPSLRTSLVGAYTNISYNAAASTMVCSAAALVGTANTLGGFSGDRACSPDWSSYSVSSRTQWNITKDFYVGLEGFYGHLNTMNKGGTALYTASATGAQPTAVRTFDDQDVFVYRMRVHRDLVP